MKQTANKLQGKNVLITAGAQGIGEAITRHFIDNGANVVFTIFQVPTRPTNWFPMLPKKA